VYLDEVGRLDHADIESVNVLVPGQLAAHRGSSADKVDANPEVTRRGHGAVDDPSRRMVAAHRVYCYAHLSRQSSVVRVVRAVVSGQTVVSKQSSGSHNSSASDKSSASSHQS
jgi:hypothetical protein